MSTQPSLRLHWAQNSLEWGDWGAQRMEQLVHHQGWLYPSKDHSCKASFWLQGVFSVWWDLHRVQPRAGTAPGTAGTGLQVSDSA